MFDQRAISLRVVDRRSRESTIHEFRADNAPVVIGRDPRSTLPIASSSISRRHVEISLRNEGWQIMDVSRLGTSLNSASLESRIPRPLFDGDRISLGSFEIFVSITDTGQTTARHIAGGQRDLHVEAASNSSACAALMMVNAAGDTREYPIPTDGTSLLMGRGDECHIRLDDTAGVISEIHASVAHEWAGTFVYDLSKNGVFVNGERISNCTELRDGDKLTLATESAQAGGIVFVVSSSSANTVRRVSPSVARDGEPDDNGEVQSKADLGSSTISPSRSEARPRASAFVRIAALAVVAVALTLLIMRVLIAYYWS